MSMKGSCLCGNTTYAFTGEPVMSAICHCKTCRKLTGTTYLTCLIVPAPNFELGDRKSAKHIKWKHESGMPLHVTFCGDCGVALYKTAEDEKLNGTVIVFSGTLDDDGRSLAKMPQAELWVKYRAPWVGKVGSGEMMQNEEFA